MLIIYIIIFILIFLFIKSKKETFYAMSGPMKHQYINCCRKNGCVSETCKSLIRNHSKKLEYLGKLRSNDYAGKRKVIYLYERFNYKKNKKEIYMRVLIKGTNNYLYKKMKVNSISTGDLFNLYNRQFKAYVPTITFFNPIYRNFEYAYDLGRRYFPISFYSNKYDYIKPEEMNKPEYIVNYRKTY